MYVQTQTHAFTRACPWSILSRNTEGNRKTGNYTNQLPDMFLIERTYKLHKKDSITFCTEFELMYEMIKGNTLYSYFKSLKLFASICKNSLGTLDNYQNIFRLLIIKKKIMNRKHVESKLSFKLIFISMIALPENSIAQYTNRQSPKHNSAPK